MRSEERRPLQAQLDTDIQDYYDDLGGLPPPHRLSGLYPASSSLVAPESVPLDASQSSKYISRQQYSTPAFDLDDPSAGMQSIDAYTPASYNQDSQSHDDFHSRDEWTTGGSRDDEAFLGGVNGLSPAVAARERYMARKEAQGSPYYYGDAAAAADADRAKRGCFAGKKKWAWIGGAVVLVAIIAGVVAGVLVHKNSTSGNKGVTGVVQSDASDPSIFTKSADLHQSFYGMCYTPLNAQYPACGDTLDSVIEDIQLISQLTTRLRLYGADCSVPSLVLEAIDKTKVNMTVFLASWLPQQTDDPNNATYLRQVSEVQAAITTYGVDHIDGITVGNEFLLNGGTEAELIEKMADMRTTLKGMNLTKTIPVGTADAGSMITTTLAAGSDYVMANVHPWFGGVPIDQAAGWVYSYTSTNDPSSATLAANDPPLYIAETGWPTGANTTADLTYQGAVAGVAELNTFLSDYVCQANVNITTGDKFSSYFYFEAFDEPWKSIYGGVEEHWGLFNSNKTLKEGLVLPDCSHP
ncbi:hypothetical protein CBS101457_005891 [Exobasidium rhododendri]|nr:hypothetical protein CBS101457_005891 [Exobasidium rhododendri]